MTPDNDITSESARLLLWAVLRWSGRSGQPTRLEKADWEWLLRDLSPQEVVTVALHSICGMKFETVGEWIGVSRGRADQYWRSALAKMREGLEVSR